MQAPCAILIAGPTASGKSALALAVAEATGGIVINADAMQVYRDLRGEAPPSCTLLAIRGESVELGEPPGASALAHLEGALQWAEGWLCSLFP